MAPRILAIKAVAISGNVAAGSADLPASGIGQAEQEAGHAIACCSVEIGCLSGCKVYVSAGCVVQDGAGVDNATTEFDSMLTNYFLRVANSGVLIDGADDGRRIR